MAGVTYMIGRRSAISTVAPQKHRWCVKVWRVGEPGIHGFAGRRRLDLHVHVVRFS